MIRYTSSKQLSIEEFKTPFEKGIDVNNRWVILARSLPWDELAGIYRRAMCPDKGAPGKDARLVIGALIVKYKLGLSGEETIQIIRENPYIQYFLGFKTFTQSPVFDAGLFSSVLKRIGIEAFNTMNREIIEKAFNTHLKGKRNGFIFSAKHTHHPSDISSNLKLVSLARITSEEIIDALCKEMNHTPRPRTYRQRAFDEYKRATDDIPHNSKENQKVIIRQISFLNRNIRSIHRLLDLVSPPVFKDNRLIITEIKPWPLDNMVLRRFWIIQQVLEQQIRMVKNGRTHISDRIIDIEHPYTRPPINTEARFRSLKKRIHLLEQAF